MSKDYPSFVQLQSCQVTYFLKTWIENLSRDCPMGKSWISVRSRDKMWTYSRFQENLWTNLGLGEDKTWTLRTKSGQIWDMDKKLDQMWTYLRHKIDKIWTWTKVRHNLVDLHCQWAPNIHHTCVSITLPRHPGEHELFYLVAKRPIWRSRLSCP